MGRIIKPYVVASAQPLAHNRFNDNFQRIYDELDGNIDDSNIKASAGIVGTKFLNASIPGSKIPSNQIGDGALDYTSAKVTRMGPTISGFGLRMVGGVKAFTFPITTTEICILVVFAVDSDQGDPIFHVTPRIVLDGIRIDSGTTTGFINTRVENVSATRALVTISSSLAPAVEIVGFLNWHAIGVV